MNDTTSGTAGGRAAAAHALAAAMGVADADLAGALLEVVDRMDALVSVKEASTGRYLHANARMADLFGRAPAQMVGATDLDLVDQAQAAILRTAERGALAQGKAVATEHRIERAGARREFTVARVALPVADAGGARHLLGVWVEQTGPHQRDEQLRQALAQLEQQQEAVAELQRRETQDSPHRDGITGLYQRPHFDDQLRREVDLSSREHREFALVSIALDPLSDAAKSIGEGARDRVLEALGRLLRGNTRAMDASCRLDEDRFAVLLSGVGLATAHSRMEGLRRQCATQIVVLDGRDLGFTVSMGVASFPHTAHDERSLLRAADAALEEARKRGGNHVALASIRFDPAG
jgi:diguanylate cyclase (GGDEF)-like protein